MRCINYLSEYLVPVVLFYIVGFAVLQKRPVFDDFIEGALAGLKTVAGILPTLVGLMAAVGVLLSNFAFNTYAMRRPFVGAPVSYREYFRGSLPTHLVGMLGGAVWCLGTAFSYIAAGKAGAAISYALGQGAPMIAAVWGVFIWKEFKGADRKTNTLLAVMFLFFIAGLASIIASGGN